MANSDPEVNPLDVDPADVDGQDRDTSAPRQETAPVYRIYKGSKIAISSAVGKLWQRKLDAATKAYEQVYGVWEEVLAYYNNNQKKNIRTPRGVFKRGDGTENVFFSNINIMVPAVYSKDPDITCNTDDETQEDFCRCLAALINYLFRNKQALNTKPKLKKAVGMGLLTNFGVLKLDWTKKDDSREVALGEMQRISAELAKVKNPKDAEDLYGQLESLEMSLELLKPGGPSLTNVLPHNLIVDPYAESPDGTDAEWMIERVHFSTAMLTARYTQPATDDDGEVEDGGGRVLVYKPTHKAAFNSSEAGARDDGLGMVMQAIEAGAGTITTHTDDERTAYMNMYTTECYLVWDKLTRRVYLFQRDDWTWPLWVWDDPLEISRYFPYFVIGFNMSTGGTVTVGETAYYLDQQDSINDINKQVARIRRAFFDYFFYNSDALDDDEANKFFAAIRGEGHGAEKHIIGVKAGEGAAVDKMFGSVIPPLAQYKELFDKKSELDAIDRITNTSDALRGVQFKTNTNEDAVQAYMESMKLSVGTKVDVVEDVVADVGIALAELCVANYTADDVEKMIGATHAKAWQQMSPMQFNSSYNLELVAGSMEKPNSVFKKKEAIQVAQSIGQFAQAAPGATLRIMLHVLEQAFTEVVIKPEDWDMLNQEIQAKMQEGVGAPTGTQPGAQSGAPAAGQGQPDIQQMAMNLPDNVKAQVVQMYKQGKTPQEIVQFIEQQLQAGGGAPAQQPQQPAAPQRTPRRSRPAAGGRMTRIQ